MRRRKIWSVGHSWYWPSDTTDNRAGKPHPPRAKGETNLWCYERMKASTKFDCAATNSDLLRKRCNARPTAIKKRILIHQSNKKTRWCAPLTKAHKLTRTYTNSATKRAPSENYAISNVQAAWTACSTTPPHNSITPITASSLISHGVRCHDSASSRDVGIQVRTAYV